jgi:hypothetical protein
MNTVADFFLDSYHAHMQRAERLQRFIVDRSHHSKSWYVEWYAMTYAARLIVSNLHTLRSKNLIDENTSIPDYPELLSFEGIIAKNRVAAAQA